MPEHPANHGLTTTPQRSGLNDNPLSMRSGRVIREAANLPLLSVHKPADTVLRRMAINKWEVLVWHLDTMANPARLSATIPSGETNQ